MWMEVTMDYFEARAAWVADRERLEEAGIHFPDAVAYKPERFGRDYHLAMDAVPAIEGPSSGGIPAMLTSFIDPNVVRKAYAPVKAAEILGEVKQGDWLTDVAFFPTVEGAGEVSSYDDYATSGRAAVNQTFPQRQPYLFQVIKEAGDRQLERAGLGRINYVAELDNTAVDIIKRFANYAYFFGVSGLQNYGLLNDSALYTTLTPATKSESGLGATWTTSGVVASAEEMYSDVLAIWLNLVNQAPGLIEQTDRLILSMHPTIAGCLSQTNVYGFNVWDKLKQNFPKLEVIQAVQLGALSAANPQGLSAGNMIMMIAPEVGGQQTGYAAYNEKLRAHPMIRQLSSYQQKLTSGVYGSVIRLPYAISTMTGV